MNKVRHRISAFGWAFRLGGTWLSHFLKDLGSVQHFPKPKTHAHILGNVLIWELSCLAGMRCSASLCLASSALVLKVKGWAYSKQEFFWACCAPWARLYLIHYQRPLAYIVGRRVMPTLNFKLSSRTCIDWVNTTLMLQMPWQQQQ